MRSVVTAFDQHFSEEAGKHTRRTMRANALAGSYNGGVPPFGYRSFTAAIFGSKEKKKLQIDDAEADVVRLIFMLATVGDVQGPMGVRAIAMWLKARGHTLKGSDFHNSNVADMLARTHYVGWYFDGKKDDDGRPLPRRSGSECHALRSSTSRPSRWEPRCAQSVIPLRPRRGSRTALRCCPLKSPNAPSPAAPPA